MENCLLNTFHFYLCIFWSNSYILMFFQFSVPLFTYLFSDVRCLPFYCSLCTNLYCYRPRKFYRNDRWIKKIDQLSEEPISSTSSTEPGDGSKIFHRNTRRRIDEYRIIHRNSLKILNSHRQSNASVITFKRGSYKCFCHWNWNVLTPHVCGTGAVEVTYWPTYREMYGRRLLRFMERSLFGRKRFRATPSGEWSLHYVGVEQLLIRNVEVFLLKASSWAVQSITSLYEWKGQIKKTLPQWREGVKIFIYFFCSRPKPRPI